MPIEFSEFTHCALVDSEYELRLAVPRILNPKPDKISLNSELP